MEVVLFPIWAVSNYRQSKENRQCNCRSSFCCGIFFDDLEICMSSDCIISRDLANQFLYTAAVKCENIHALGQMDYSRIENTNASAIELQPCGNHVSQSLTFTQKAQTNKRVQLYSNTTASRQILLRGGDISVNPGPTVPQTKGTICKQKCPTCKRTIARNHQSDVRRM